jgi:hypothetical protein
VGELSIPGLTVSPFEGVVRPLESVTPDSVWLLVEESLVTPESVWVRMAESLVTVVLSRAAPISASSELFRAQAAPARSKPTIAERFKSDTCI